MTKMKVILLLSVSILLSLSNAYSFPTLIFPKEDSTLNDTTIKFIWHNDPLRNVRSDYLFELSKERTFSEPLVNKRTDKMEIMVSLEPGKYFWRVSRQDRTTLKKSIIYSFDIALLSDKPEENELEIIIKELQETISELNIQLIQKNETIEKLNGQFNNAKEQISDYRDKVNNLQAKTQVMEEENLALRKRVEVALKDSDILTNLSKNREESARKIAEYSETIKQQESALLKSDNIIKELHEEVVKLNNDLLITNQIKNKQKEEYETQIQELKNSIEKQMTSRQHTDEMITRLNNELQELRKKNEEHQNIIQDYQNKFLDLQSSYKDNQNNVFAEYEQYLINGYNYFLQNNYFKAEELFRKALELYDKDDAVFYNLAVLYYSLNYNEHALDRISRALSLNPDSIDNIILKLSTLIKLDNEHAINNFITEIKNKNISDKRLNQIIDNYLNS